MKALLSSFVLLFLLGACSGQGGYEKAAAKEFSAGDIVADNMIIYDGGRQSTYGDQSLTGSGGFAPMGPNVVYVIRSVSSTALEKAKEDGLHIIAHTAYRIPAGEPLSFEVMKEMKPIGHVDSELSEAEVMALFSFGG